MVEFTPPPPPHHAAVSRGFHKKYHRHGHNVNKFNRNVQNKYPSFERTNQKVKQKKFVFLLLIAERNCQQECRKFLSHPYCVLVLPQTDILFLVQIIIKMQIFITFCNVTDLCNVMSLIPLAHRHLQVY
uniref:Uncharacterized protein n=1 Tax=Cacopsylla melanoneura TaxID=428564 RepID=A0A8D8RAD3_9HEMI